MEDSLFQEVADALCGLVPAELGPLRYRVRRYGIKTWLGSEQPPREHYEAQVIGSDHVPGAKILALEVGFHSEYPSPGDNEAVIEALLGSQRLWRRELGAEAVAGAFLGPADHWRRLSETWPDPDLGDPGLGFEVAARLTDYVMALEPRRRESTPGTSKAGTSKAGTSTAGTSRARGRH